MTFEVSLIAGKSNINDIIYIFKCLKFIRTNVLLWEKEPKMLDKKE